MTRKIRDAIVGCLSATTALVVFSLCSQFAPVVSEKPEQSYYVVYIEVCGKLEFVTALTDGHKSPWANRYVPASDELLELMLNVDAEHFVYVRHWDDWCPEPPVKS